MRTLVTGCAGFIGSQLAESLLGDGEEVIGVDCFNNNYGRRDKLRNLENAMDWSNFSFVPIDLARGDLGDIVSECDVVFHLAAEPGVRASWGQRFESYVRNNVMATQHLLEAVKSIGGKRIVFASSSSVYGDAEDLPTSEDALPRPISPYGVTKLAAEQLCVLYHQSYGVDTVCLRFFSVYGPRQRPDMAFSAFFRSALEDEPIVVYGDGEQTRDFTYVDDVVTATRGTATAAGVDGRVYNIGGGSRVSVNHALELISLITGRQIQVERRRSGQGDARHTSADTTRARADLGFAPATPLQAGLEAQYEWLLASAASTPSPT